MNEQQLEAAVNHSLAVERQAVLSPGFRPAACIQATVDRPFPARSFYGEIAVAAPGQARIAAAAMAAAPRHLAAPRGQISNF